MICSSSIYHNFKQRTIIEMQEIKEWIKQSKIGFNIVKMCVNTYTP